MHADVGTEELNVTVAVLTLLIQTFMSSYIELTTIVGVEAYTVSNVYVTVSEPPKHIVPISYEIGGSFIKVYLGILCKKGYVLASLFLSTLFDLDTLDKITPRTYILR